VPRARAPHEAQHLHLGPGGAAARRHTINIEDPEAFNRALFEFFMLVDEGRCTPRDPRSAASGILGFRK
jgi:hypothetical protein